MKNILENKLLKKLLIFIAVIIVIIITLVVVFSIIRGNDKNYGYKKISDDIISASKRYYSSLETKLSNGEFLVVTDKDLIEKKYLKDYSSDLDEGVVCNGKVIIRNNFGNIMYFPYLDCGTAYKDITLSEYVLNNNKVVTSGDGLYELEGEYVFRGEYVKNNVVFAGKNWVITKINSDGSLRLISTVAATTEDETTWAVWDDRYNVDDDSYIGINDFYKSRIKNTLDTLSSGETFLNNSQKGYVMPQTVCVGKRSIHDSNISYKTECSQVYEKQLFGLPQVNEYLIGSIDPNCNNIDSPSCTNYNYFYNKFYNSSMWTLTYNEGTSYYVFVINKKPYVTYTNKQSNLYLTINLAPENLYLSGDGSVENPYSIKAV